MFFIDKKPLFFHLTGLQEIPHDPVELVGLLKLGQVSGAFHDRHPRSRDVLESFVG